MHMWPLPEPEKTILKSDKSSASLEMKESNRKEREDAFAKEVVTLQVLLEQHN